MFIKYNPSNPTIAPTGPKVALWQVKVSFFRERAKKQEPRNKTLWSWILFLRLISYSCFLALISCFYTQTAIFAA
jgi:hypothetical protein